MKLRKKKLTKNIIVYLVLRFLVILCAIGQALRGDWNNVFMCVITLLLFTIPIIIKRRFNIKLPGTLEIIVYLFIFAAEILGEIQNFYSVFRHWDTMLHTINGFIAAAVGFSLVDILNREENVRFNLSPIFVALVALCFSMTIGVLWEFGEYAVDKYLIRDSQKDTIVNRISSVTFNEEGKNDPVVIKDITKTKIYSEDKLVMVIDGGYLDIGLIDTMKDLFVNFLGAVLFSIFGFLYIKDRDDYRFLERFIPVLKGLKETSN